MALTIRGQTACQLMSACCASLESMMATPSVCGAHCPYDPDVILSDPIVVLADLTTSTAFYIDLAAISCSSPYPVPPVLLCLLQARS